MKNQFLKIVAASSLTVCVAAFAGATYFSFSKASAAHPESGKQVVKAMLKDLKVLKRLRETP